MLNLPFVSPQLTKPEAVAPRNNSDNRREDSGFSDVYDDVDRPDAPAAPEARDPQDAPPPESDEEVSDTDSRPDQDSEGPEDRDPEDADFVAVKPQDTTNREVQPAGADRKQMVGSSESAALMRLAPQVAVLPSDGAQQARAVAPTAEAKTAVDVATLGRTQTAQAVPAQVQAAQAAIAAVAPQSALAAETPEGLDPMRVVVRKAGERTMPATPVPVVPKTSGDTADVMDVDIAARDVDTDTEAGEGSHGRTKPEPIAANPQQWQARATVDATQTLTKPSVATPDIMATTSVDPAMVTVEESNTRLSMTPQEAMSQARLAQSAPNPAQVVRQLADAVRTTDDNVVELTMDPPELGRVRMSISEASGVTTITIAADNQATSELMRRHIDMLRKDFAELGHQNVSFSFEQGNSDGQRQTNGEVSQGDGSGQQGDVTQASDARVPPPNAPQTTPTTGLDIRI